MFNNVVLSFNTQHVKQFVFNPGEHHFGSNLIAFDTGQLPLREGDIVAQPQFAKLSGPAAAAPAAGGQAFTRPGDFALSPKSPAVDSGLKASPGLPVPEVDLLGKSRLPSPDRGALEY